MIAADSAKTITILPIVICAIDVRAVIKQPE